MGKLILEEHNVVIKDLRRAEVKVAVAYPSLYRVAISSLSFHMLYYGLNNYDFVAAERVVFDRQLYPNLAFKTLESKSPLKVFDAIVFSVHYEMDYANIAFLLQRSGIPVFSKDRSEGDPIVVAGGPSLTANPYPMLGIADAIALGEMERPLRELVEALHEGRSRRDALELLASSKHYLVAGLKEDEGERYWLSDIDESLQPVAQVQPVGERFQPIYGRCFLLEVMRGCPRCCNFCLLAHNFKPARQKSLEKLLSLLDEGTSLNQVNKVVLLASSLLDYRWAERLLEYVVEERKLQLSCPSLFVTRDKEHLLRYIAQGGQRTLTIAPETGTEELRRIVGKAISDDDVLHVSKEAKAAGFKKLKLYFMVGIPGEEREDLEAIVELVARVIEESNFKAPRSVHVSINPLVPKANTPMQWFGFSSLDEIRKKLFYLRKSLSSPYVVVDTLSPKGAEAQAVLSLGGKELARAIALWASFGGSISGWRRALRQAGIKADEILKPKSIEHEFPWSKLKSNEKLLAKKYEKLCTMISSKLRRGS